MRHGRGIGITLRCLTVNDWNCTNCTPDPAQIIRGGSFLYFCRLRNPEFLDHEVFTQFLRLQSAIGYPNMTSPTLEFAESGNFPINGLGKWDTENLQVGQGLHIDSNLHLGRRRVHLAAFVFTGCCIILFWVFSDCLSIRAVSIAETNATVVAPSALVKYEASSAASSTTGVLEVFQVYQPVLTPTGATDETVMSNGTEDTTTIAPTTPETSCQVVLMQHDFAYSYGLPFVGELPPFYVL